MLLLYLLSAHMVHKSPYMAGTAFLITHRCHTVHPHNPAAVQLCRLKDFSMQCFGRQLKCVFFFRSVHHCHVQKVPSGALCVLLLPETAQQGNFQRAERQTILSRLLRQALRLSRRTNLSKTGVEVAVPGGIFFLWSMGIRIYWVRENYHPNILQRKQSCASYLLDRIKERRKGQQRRFVLPIKKKRQKFSLLHIWRIPVLTVVQENIFRGFVIGVLTPCEHRLLCPTSMQYLWYLPSSIVLAIYCCSFSKCYCSYQYKKQISYHVIFTGFVISYCYMWMQIDLTECWTVLKVGNGNHVTPLLCLINKQLPFTNYNFCLVKSLARLT